MNREKRRVVEASAVVLLAFLWLGSARSEEKFDREPILTHLNAVISWYRSSTNPVQTVGLPSDAIYQETARNLAVEAVRLEFAWETASAWRE